MECSQTPELLIRKREDLLDAAASRELSGHLSMCAGCTVLADEDGRLAAMLHTQGAAWRNAPITPEAIAVHQQRFAPTALRDARLPGRRRAGIIRAAAIAAIILGCGTIFLYTPPIPGNTLLAATLTQMRTEGTIRVKASIAAANREAGEYVMYAHGAGKLRVEGLDGRIMILNADRGESVVLLPAKRSIRQASSDSMPFDPYEAILGLASSDEVEELGMQEVDGRPAIALRVKHTESFGQFAGEAQEVFVWLDPVSLLPVKVRAESASGSLTLSGFEFDMQLDASVFDTRPEGYTPGPPALDRHIAAQLVMKSLRDISMACLVYVQEHGEAWPPSLEALTPRYLSTQAIQNPRDPDGGSGFGYRVPAADALSTNPSGTVLAFETFKTWPGEAGVVHLDGHVQMIRDEAEFQRFVGRAP